MQIKEVVIDGGIIESDTKAILKFDDKVTCHFSPTSTDRVAHERARFFPFLQIVFVSMEVPI